MTDIPPQIGPYQVQREIGRGGMGVVYLALDTNLDREVAIKAVPEEWAEDAARLARLEQEARSLAQVSHPNIAGIYGVEQLDGRTYLILEYVEGDTLGDRIDAGSLPIDEALELAVGIASGVEAAHEVGVIHRDLKPDNIKITTQGKVKVLDFGLAKVTDVSTSSVDQRHSPTMTTPRSPTIPGAILGTAAYMSPEQARGRHVDKRADIWSFGVILYEMLTGIGPFAGETATDSIGAVLHKEIGLDALPAGTPAGVRRLLTRCVVRDKSLRYRDIGDVRVELIRSQQEPDEDPRAAAAAKGGIGHWAIAAVLMLVFAAAGYFAADLLNPEPPPRVGRFDLVTANEELSLSDTDPKISPDGSLVAYLQDEEIHVRSLDSFESRALSGTEGAQEVFWSPDGTWIGYHTSRAVRKVSLVGGDSIELADNLRSLGWISGGGWTSDDRIVLANGQDGIVSIPARGGEPTEVMPVDSDKHVDFHDVRVIPGTNTLLYVQHMRDMSFVVTVFDGEREVVIAEMSDTMLGKPTWSPSGHVLFTRGAGKWSIWAVAFDLDRMEVLGEPFLVVPEGVQPSVSNDGTLVFQRGDVEMGGGLAWLTRAGDVEPIEGEFDVIFNPMLSPDGTRIAFSAGNPTNLEVWVHDLERGINSRMTFDEGFVMAAGWSPDGSELAVMRFNPESDTRVRTSFLHADGTGESRPSVDGILGAFDVDWSHAIWASEPMDRNATLYAVELDDLENKIPLESLEGDTDFRAALSPDGTLLLYTSDESGENQVYCTRFPEGTGKWQVSTKGGRNPRWIPDGKRIIFESTGEDMQLYEVDVTTEPTLRFGMPAPVLAADPNNVDLRRNGWCPSADGERFVVVLTAESEDDTTSSISIIQNWYEEHRDR